jgi:hypothetical protein
MEAAAYTSSAPPPPLYSHYDGQQGKPIVAYAVEDSTGVLGGAPLAEAYRYPAPPAV